MATLINLLLIVHIAAGMTALVSGFMAAITQKGGARHRGSGRVYFWSMTAVFLTAISLGILKEKWFLFMVGFFSYYMVVRGYRILYLKKLGAGQRASRLDWLLAGTGLLFGSALVFLSLRQGLQAFSPVPFVFGIICISFARKDIHLFIKGPKYKQHWIFGHIAGMGGGYIATWTAFLVTNVTFLPPVLVWLMPTLIGGTLISLTIRRYRLGATPLRAAMLLLFFLNTQGLWAQDDTQRSRRFYQGITYGNQLNSADGAGGFALDGRWVFNAQLLWGHAEGYIAVPSFIRIGTPVWNGQRIRGQHRLEAGVRVYPWQRKPGSVRPFAGVSVRSLPVAYTTMNESGGITRVRNQVVLPLQAGLTYSRRRSQFSLAGQYTNRQPVVNLMWMRRIGCKR